jgi:hypothetical protein
MGLLLGIVAAGLSGWAFFSWFLRLLSEEKGYWGYADEPHGRPIFAEPRHLQNPVATDLARVRQLPVTTVDRPS